MDSQAETLSQPVATLLGLLYSRRRLIVGVGLISAIASVIISLFLPKYYLGSAKLLLPEGSGGSTLTAVLGDLAPTAASLLGGAGGGDFDRYRAILSSRTVLEQVIEEFDLLDVYKARDTATPMLIALSTLSGNVDFTVNAETGYLAVEVLDRDPNRAAEMANYFVELLNQRNADLLAQSAKENRLFMGEMLAENESRLDSARSALVQVQAKYGIIDLPAQTQAFFEGLAAIRTEVQRAQIEYEARRLQLGPEHASTRTARSVYQAANATYQSALNGSEAVLPVAQDTVAYVAKLYAEAYQEVVIQSELFKFLKPVYEQSRFDEQRERTAVQVMDRAVPPERKDRPKRSLFVISVTASMVLLTIFMIIVRHWIRQNGAAILSQVKRNMPTS